METPSNSWGEGLETQDFENALVQSDICEANVWLFLLWECIPPITIFKKKNQFKLMPQNEQVML